MGDKNGLLFTAGFGFFVGLTESNMTQEQIEEENSFYGDIIQIGTPDFFRNLSLKVAGLLNWLHRNCPKVDFVMKVDDDVYVNVRNLAHFVQSHHQENLSVFGVGDPTGGVPDRGNFISITDSKLLRTPNMYLSLCYYPAGKVTYDLIRSHVILIIPHVILIRA